VHDQSNQQTENKGRDHRQFKQYGAIIDSEAAEIVRWTTRFEIEKAQNGGPEDGKQAV
jgi:hypothetical protein